MLRPRRSATRSRSTPALLPAVMVLTDSIAAQRTSREPCLVIRPRWTWVSDSWCLGVSPAQQVSFGAEANEGDVADLGHEHRPQGGPDARDLLDRGVPRLVGHAAADHASEQVDLEVQVINQPAQRSDPGRIRGRQVQPV